MVSIVWTHLAKEDLKSVYDFIAKDSYLFAIKEVNKIEQTVLKLKTQPLLGKIVIEGRGYELRELIISNYRVIYELSTTSRIDILFIHHGARDLSNRLKKL